MPKYTVMITCGGGGLSPFLTNQLKNNSRHKDLKIVVVDYNKNAIGKYFCDKFEQVPFGNSKKYIPFIIKLIKKYKIDLIIPASDEEALQLSKNKDKIEKLKTKITSINYNELRIISSKVKTYKTLSNYGFVFPKWLEIRNINDLKQGINDFLKLKKNFVIKPSSSRGGRNITLVKINSLKGKFFKKKKNKFLNEILLKYKGIYPLIISEELFEPIFDLDLLSWNGKFLKGVVRRRVDPSDPNAGNIIVKNKKIIDQGKKIAKLFNLSWLYDCDFMLDKKGNPVLIEMNPRMSGSASVSVAAGIPLFDDIISLARNKRVPKKEIPIGRKIIAFKSLKEFI